MEKAKARKRDTAEDQQHHNIKAGPRRTKVQTPLKPHVPAIRVSIMKHLTGEKQRNAPKQLEAAAIWGLRRGSRRGGSEKEASPNDWKIRTQAGLTNG